MSLTFRKSLLYPTFSIPTTAPFPLQNNMHRTQQSGGIARCKVLCVGTSAGLIVPCVPVAVGILQDIENLVC